MFVGEQQPWNPDIKMVIAGLSVMSVMEKCQQNFLQHTHTHTRLQKEDMQNIAAGAERKSCVARYLRYLKKRREQQLHPCEL
jgi:hypothetical protein